MHLLLSGWRLAEDAAAAPLGEAAFLPPPYVRAKGSGSQPPPPPGTPAARAPVLAHPRVAGGSRTGALPGRRAEPQRPGQPLLTTPGGQDTARRLRVLPLRRRPLHICRQPGGQGGSEAARSAPPAAAAPARASALPLRPCSRSAPGLGGGASPCARLCGAAAVPTSVS